MERKSVLVLCTGNSCRSQIAEAWLRHDLGDRIDVFSAGTHPSIVHPVAVRVMAEEGIDLSGHTSKSLSQFWGHPFDLVVTVCDSAAEACPVFFGAKKQIHEPIPDPVSYVSDPAEALDRFREVRDLIRERLVPLVRREL